MLRQYDPWLMLVLVIIESLQDHLVSHYLVSKHVSRSVTGYRRQQ